MMRSRLLFLTMAGLPGLLVVLGAEGDAAVSQSETGDLGIAGTVMLPGTREPLAGVRVTLRRLPAAGGFAILRPAQSESVETTTDASGRFRFVDLAPGRYEVQPRFPEEPDRDLRPFTGRVELAERGPPLNLELWLPRRSAITGQVRDAVGSPVSGATVRLMSVVWNEEPVLVSASDSASERTDEDGRYTVHAPPGEYFLEVASPEERTSLVHYYYPGVQHAGNAAPLTLHSGVDLAGIDVILDDAELYPIRFDLDVDAALPDLPAPPQSYMGTDVAPIRAYTLPIDRGRFRLSQPVEIDLEVLGEGAYRTPPLPTGDYELILHWSGELADATGLDWESYWQQRDPFARLRISVDPDMQPVDADGVLDLGTIPEAPKAVIPVRVVGPPDRDTVLPDGVWFWFTDTVFGGGGLRPSTQDAAFLLEGAYPGLFRFEADATRFPQGWYIAAVRSGGRDVLRDGLEVGGSVSGVEIEVRDDAARVAGVARNSDGELLPAVRIVLVPPAGQRGRTTRFPTAEASATGAFAIDGLSPGTYRILALDVAGRVTATSDRYWESPEFIRMYELRGNLITVDPGAQLTINADAIPLVY